MKALSKPHCINYTSMVLQTSSIKLHRISTISLNQSTFNYGACLEMVPSSGMIFNLCLRGSFAANKKASSVIRKVTLKASCEECEVRMYN